MAPATASRAFYSDVRAEVGSSRVEHRPVGVMLGISVPPSGVEPDVLVDRLGTLLGPEGTGESLDLGPIGRSVRRTVMTG